MNEAFVRETSRRTFLGRGAAGLGVVALNALLGPRVFAETQAPALPSRGVVNPLHFPPKAKRVIFLYQAGGPSHLETFDSSRSSPRCPGSRCRSRSPEDSRSPSSRDRS